MRERGSNTARPREKGGGGLPIGARPVDFGASIRADSVASRRDLQTSSWRFVPKPGATPRDTEDKTQKSPIPQSWNRASDVASRRALLTFL